MVRVKNCAILLLSVCCIALIVAQRTPPPRSGTPTLVLVDNTTGLAPLYQSSDPTVRRNGSYIIKLKQTTEFDDFGRFLGKLSDQNKNAPSGAVPVQGLRGYSTVGLGVIAELNDDALKVVGISVYTMPVHTFFLLNQVRRLWARASLAAPDPSQKVRVWYA